MFDRFLHPKPAPAPPASAPAAPPPDTSGDTATVRRIVAKLEAMPVDRARLAAATAYTIARAANADLDISDDEATVIEHELQEHGLLDEPTAVLVTEMARLQAKTVGGTEDYVVTREFKKLSTMEQRLDVVRACFAVSAASGSISAEESAIVNEIANELDVAAIDLNALRAEYHDRLTSVQEVRRLAGQAG
jgi:tellurite resistance protein